MGRAYGSSIACKKGPTDRSARTKRRNRGNYHNRSDSSLNNSSFCKILAVREVVYRIGEVLAAFKNPILKQRIRAVIQVRSYSLVSGVLMIQLVEVIVDLDAG